MWVQWVKKSSSTPAHTSSPSFTDNYFHHQTSPFHPPPSSPRTPGRGPIHKHSVSFKDIESLLSNSPNYPSSPLHKQSLSYREPAQARRSPAHANISLKDVHSLCAETDPGQAQKNGGPSIFHRVRAWAQRQAQPQTPPDSQNKVVVYYTSLGVVRRTYEDCRAVRSILRGYRVRMDERDLSMDGAYVEEMEKIIGGGREKVVKMLPRVYVNGKCIGGVDDVRWYHESGELKKVLKEVPVEGGKKGEGGGVGVGVGGECMVCGGCKYVVCEYCDGSHKVYLGKIDGFVSCSVCNVNGLVKCPCTCIVF